MITKFQKTPSVSFPVFKSQGELFGYWFRQTDETVICVIFSKEKNRPDFFELNYHVLQKGKLNLFTRTNNHEAIRTFNTLALIIFDFIKNNKSATVGIEAPDRFRNIFYHSCIARMEKELQENFRISGIYYFGFEELFREKFRTDRFYDEITIRLNVPEIPHSRESDAYKMSKPEEEENRLQFL